MGEVMKRRPFLAASGAALASGVVGRGAAAFAGRDKDSPSKVSIELPRLRVPLSFIIDDSTCLVNMGKFCMPQFAATYPNRKDYQFPWKQWPDEIPDAFVRQFGEWCADQGVRGKYSIVPFPACVGWLDRTLPGWSQQELNDSLKLVRDLLLPSWDIHPEMITHTRVIDLKTGRPFADYTPKHMENTYPQEDVSVDYLASYLAYSLRILKNCGLPCDGITTPGGFGTKVKDKLPVATFQAVRDVFGSRLPHYFKYVIDDPGISTAPTMEAVQNSGGVVECCVNVPAGTGDWFGGWEGATAVQADRYATEDGQSGRMVELIRASEPAVMLCHWPGMYCNGSLEGFKAFQRVVLTLKEHYGDQTLWMKVSEIAEYWAAKEYTNISLRDGGIDLNAPYPSRHFTFRCQASGMSDKVLHHNNGDAELLREVQDKANLKEGTFLRDQDSVVLCLQLQQGQSSVEFRS